MSLYRIGIASRRSGLPIATRRGASASDAREPARRLRAEVAGTHEDAAAEYERAVERFTTLPATTTGPTADRLRELATRATAHATRKRALAADSRARSTPSG